MGGGIIGLAEVVKSFKFKKEGKWQIEASVSHPLDIYIHYANSEFDCLKGSSLGGLDNFWLAQFLAAASGVSPSSYFSKDTPMPSSNISGTSRPTDKISRWNAPIKIIFPTLSNVDHSINGRPVSTFRSLFDLIIAHILIYLKHNREEVLYFVRRNYGNRQDFQNIYFTKETTKDEES